MAKQILPKERSIFEKILNAATLLNLIRLRTPQSRSWFQRNVQVFAAGVTPTDILRDGKVVGRTKDSFTPSARWMLGSMFMFIYDPKTKDSLPFYDKFPLVFPIGLYSDGFLGINLHYLPYNLRAILFYKLIKIASNPRFDGTTKLQLSYEVLSATRKYKEFAPCLKRYLYSHVRSAILKVHPDEWEIAIFLPVEQFEKATVEEVWADSKTKI